MKCSTGLVADSAVTEAAVEHLLVVEVINTDVPDNAAAFEIKDEANEAVLEDNDELDVDGTVAVTSATVSKEKSASEEVPGAPRVVETDKTDEAATFEVEDEA